MIRKFIYNLGEKIRNPSLKKKYNFLKESEKWSLEKLEGYQLKKLKELLKIAYDNSEFYKQKFDAEQLDINEVKTLEDLKFFPIINKKDLITYTSQIHTNLNFKKTFLASTSGTSGESLKFVREENADSFNRATIQRGYSWYNIHPWDRNGYFWGFSFSFISQQKNKILDFFQNRYRIFSYEETALKEFIKKSRKAKYIHGYSSMIYQTALLINKLNLPKPLHLKMIKGTSEKIFESYHSEIKKAFGLDIISEYGATESGIIAYECIEGNMHLNMEGVLVEEVDGEIIITNLQLQSFPIIRYQLGDYISLAPRDKKCACGMNHLILEEVTGRIGENVYGIHNTYPSLYFYYIFKNLSKREHLNLNYQVIQDKKGVLEFRLEQEINDIEMTLLRDEIKVYFKQDILISIFTNVKLLAVNGKFKSFISNVKL
ncbi:phenylacetate--CoA ligase family protein [Polaribacter undariae]|uniref:Phenylacetate--CoA ligase family protein n=2 Tax=Polaribacter sejongensis TaxID=985043 RepID=A0AAJ1VH22_9FLAO|nr:phenylacetate--CoA ligase family protein [Polaribacter undariae]MDN3618927.1 phenylacetate--CoA ligase family protein [Polaribacter undariae]UWD33016.1 phenylacetate--CoA ligase family protein [Polaribacter undariae]